MIKVIVCPFVSQAEVVANELEKFGCELISVAHGIGNVYLWIRRPIMPDEVSWARETFIEINRRLAYNGERQLGSITL